MKAKAVSCSRFGNLGSFETWRETRKSEGIINAKESHRNYLINKNNGYKVDACFNRGKAQVDIFKVPASTSEIDTDKALHDMTFENIRSPKVQRVNRNEMSVSFKVPDEKSETKQFAFSGRNER